MDDRFNQVWARTGDYPNTILRPLRSHEYHERDSRCEKLKQEQDDLFDDSEQKMEFWETGRENRSLPCFVLHTISFSRNVKFKR